MVPDRDIWRAANLLIREHGTDAELVVRVGQMLPSPAVIVPLVKAGSMMQAELRRALPDEAANLSALALRSKALWGYDAAFMEACRSPLTVDPEAIAKCPFYVPRRRRHEHRILRPERPAPSGRD